MTRVNESTPGRPLRLAPTCTCPGAPAPLSTAVFARAPWSSYPEGTGKSVVFHGQKQNVAAVLAILFRGNDNKEGTPTCFVYGSRTNNNKLGLPWGKATFLFDYNRRLQVDSLSNCQERSTPQISLKSLKVTMLGSPPPRSKTTPHTWRPAR